MTASVVPLARSLVACPACGSLATWRVRGLVEERACDSHVGEVAQLVPCDGFSPLTLVRIFPKGRAS